MRLPLLVILGLALVTAVSPPTVSGAAPVPVKVIFDTDMDSDCDDVGALAVLHALADLGEAEILATVVSGQNEWAPGAVDAINTFYGRPDVPIGQPKGAGPNSPSKFARQLAERFPQDVGRGAQVRDALEVYRQVLSRQPDQSVVIVTVGDLTNVAGLLRLPGQGDRRSGLDLVRKKVQRWVCMGGNFIGKPAKDDLKLGNNNFTLDAESSHHAVTNWPAPLTFIGREIGSVPSGLKVGARLAELPESNPIRMGYQYYFDGQVKDRHVADLTTTLFAVRGTKDYWDIETRGYMDLKPDMTFAWKYDQDRQHSYLLKRQIDGRPNDRQIEAVLEKLMLQPPRKG